MGRVTNTPSLERIGVSSAHALAIEEGASAVRRISLVQH